MSAESIYIHFPFCIKKCHYCDFYSLEDIKAIPKFLDYLNREIELFSQNLDHKPKLKTIFMGGGTPSLMYPEQLDALVKLISAYYDLNDLTEFTIESNPGTISRQKISEYKSIGVNRISVGAQSFIKSELEFLQRIHDAPTIERSIANIRNAGIDNINIDLMFALPGQTPQSYQYNIEKAVDLGTDHISAYSLIFEEGTPLYADFALGKVNPLNHDDDFELYNATWQFLSQSGFDHYEISNFSKNSKVCLHNINYWERKQYFAFGPSAHGFLDNFRFWNYRNLGIYFREIDNGNLPVQGKEEIDNRKALYEFVDLSLRFNGFMINQLFDDFVHAADFSHKMSAFMVIANKYIDMGDATLVNGRFKLTNSGYFIANTIAIDILNIID